MWDLSSVLASTLRAFKPSTPNPQPALGPNLTFLTRIFFGLANKVSTPGSFHSQHPFAGVCFFGLVDFLGVVVFFSGAFFGQMTLPDFDTEILPLEVKAAKVPSYVVQ